MAEQYIDPILKKYADLITEHTGAIKKFYYGDPIRIGASEMPVCVLQKIDTSIGTHTNLQDRHSIRIMLTIITDIRKDISDEAAIVPGISSLYNLIEGRDPNTYELRADSILGILRNHVELDVAHNLRTDLETETSTDYGMTHGKRQEGSWSIEGVITLTANFIQLR